MKKLTPEQRKALLVFVALLALCLGFGMIGGCITAKADAPAFNGSGSETVPYSEQEVHRMYQVALAQQGLGVLRASSNYAVPVAIYMTPSATSGQYIYHLLVNSSTTGRYVTPVGGATTPATAVHVNGAGWYDYVWDASRSGGWVYNRAVSANSDVACSAYLGGIETTVGSWRWGTTEGIFGFGILGFGAQSWLDAWDVKLNGLPTSEGYDEGLADGYETGFADGYETGFADGYETGFGDGASSVPPSGETVIVEQIDLMEAISAYPLAIRAIFGTAFDLNIGGIVLGSALSVLLVVLVIVFVWKKVF